MNEVFRIQNIEAIDPNMKGHDLVLNDSIMCSKYMKQKPEAASPNFWQHYPRSENPYFSEDHYVDDEGWICKKDKKGQRSNVVYAQIKQNADIIQVGSNTITMFQDPYVSYTHVLMKRSLAMPFENPDHDGSQIWFDLWTPYHNSVSEALHIFTSYDLIKDSEDLHKAIEFVESNLEKYKPMLFA